MQIFQLLHKGVDVEKYSFGRALLGHRKRKRLRLSADNHEILYGPRTEGADPEEDYSKFAKNAAAVPINEILGVVFGAYTCTFKKQKPRHIPPHRSAFSLIGRHRTYDFRSDDPEVVETCILGIQQLTWDLARETGTTRHKLPPWSLGAFLWMRLRFRLQETARKAGTDMAQMLWIVFMRCAFAEENILVKRRFLEMAGYLERRYGLERGQGASTGMSAEHLRTLYQRDRAEAILEGHYECKLEQCLPRAPPGVGQDTSGRRRVSPRSESRGRGG